MNNQSDGVGFNLDSWLTPPHFGLSFTPLQLHYSYIVATNMTKHLYRMKYIGVLGVNYETEQIQSIKSNNLYKTNGGGYAL